jgi:hypothetical protein
MKTYIAKFSIIDGEHEHHSEFLLKARSHDEAFKIAKSQEHEPTILEDDVEPTYWDYGDGTTASRLKSVVEITEAEAGILRRLGLVCDFN